MSATTFNGLVGRIKSEIRRRAARGATEISAVDVANVMRSRVSGTSRGAVVRRAFSDLVDEGFLRATNQTEYNPDTHHSVTVYRVRG
jgi:hypothetical protein